MKTKKKTRKNLETYRVYGYIPRLALSVNEFTQECSKQQALKVANLNLRKRYPHIVVPPLGLYCNVIRVRNPQVPQPA